MRRARRAMIARKRVQVFKSHLDARYGGDPVLWQHIFWVFGHPEVYIMFIPAVGILSHVVQTFTRRPVMSYTLMVLAIIATGFLGFGLWVHHMFTTGISPMGMGFFAAASMAVDSYVFVDWGPDFTAQQWREFVRLSYSEDSTGSPKLSTFVGGKLEKSTQRVAISWWVTGSQWTPSHDVAA